MTKTLFLCFGLLFLFDGTVVLARPLLTETVAPLGKYYFEAGTSIWQREDKFESPESKLSTIVFPSWLKIGLSPKIDFGVNFLHVTQSLETGNVKYKGALGSRVSPEIKFAANEHVGFKAIWHTHRAENSDDSLPLGVGNDWELLALFKAPIAWPMHLNVGFDRRGTYRSKLGVANVESVDIDPGDIFEILGSVEVPLPKHFFILGEAAYYQVGKTKYDHESVNNTSGEAGDILIGLGWAYEGWIIQVGSAFGLLDESHTSFDFMKGAGDSLYRAQLSYRLKPSKPQQ